MILQKKSTVRPSCEEKVKQFYDYPELNVQKSEGFLLLLTDKKKG